MIEIKNKDKYSSVGNFYFTHDLTSDRKTMYEYCTGRKCDDKCNYCKRSLDPQYSYVVDKLKKRSLLPENYKKRCCYCHWKLTDGLMEE